MLRSASDSVPPWRAAESVATWSGLSSSVTVLPTHGVLAVLFLRRLVDREHADVGQDDLGQDEVVAAGRAVGAVRILQAAGQHDVDAVVRQDEAAGAGLG